MKHQAGTLAMPDGTKLATHEWIPDQATAKATIVIAHGYGEHGGRYTHVAEYFTQQGYALYAADHRGHGQSRGATMGYFESFAALVEDLKQITEWAHSQRRNSPLFLLGHSMGGLLALSYTLKYQFTIKGLIVSATYMATSQEFSPAQGFVARLLSKTLPRLAVASRVDSATLSRDSAVGRTYDQDPEVYHGKVSARVGVEIVNASENVLANLKKITLPILILHGSQDRIAKPEYTQRLYDGIGSTDKTIKIYDGLYHEILNEPEKSRVMADIWVWLAAHQGTGELRAAQQKAPSQ